MKNYSLNDQSMIEWPDFDKLPQLEELKIERVEPTIDELILGGSLGPLPLEGLRDLPKIEWNN